MNPFAILLDLFLPRICHICETKLLPSEQFLCSGCLAKLPRTGYEKYRLNTSTPNSDLNPLELRFAGQIPIERGCAPFFYSKDSSLATLVHDFKYRGFSNLAITMGSLGALTLKDSGLFEGVDLLLPIPLHWFKRLKRGYNQSEMIAEGISAETGIPIGTNLTASKPHRTQTSLSPNQRIANTRDIFRIRNPRELDGKTIMLVDDICTTGATLLSAANAILDASKDVKFRIFTLGVV